MGIKVGVSTNDVLIHEWKNLIDSVDKGEFSTDFIDKIHITFIDETDLPNTIDVKKLRALDHYITKAQVGDIIDAALLEVQDKIKYLDLIVDIEAVMEQAIPHCAHYLSKLN